MSDNPRIAGHVSSATPSQDSSSPSSGGAENQSQSVSNMFNSPEIANEIGLGILFSDSVKDEMGRTSELTLKTIEMIKEIDSWIMESVDGNKNLYKDFIRRIKNEFNISNEMNSYKKLDKFYSYMKMNKIVFKKKPLTV